MNKAVDGSDSVQKLAWPGGRFMFTCRRLDGAISDHRRNDGATVIADLECAGVLTRDLCIAGARYHGPFTPRQVHCVPARVQWAQRFTGRACFAYATLTLGADLLAQAAAGMPRAGGIEIEPQTHRLDPCLLELVCLLRQELRGDEHANTLVLESLAMIAAVYLLRRHAHANSCPPRVSAGLDRRRLARVTEYVEAHLEHNITLVDLAAVAHLSRYHFCRRFKTSTGLTPHGYVTGRRLERAKGLLTHSHTSIAQVAQDVGLSSHSHLSRLFRQAFGVTPAQFRRATAGGGR